MEFLFRTHFLHPYPVGNFLCVLLGVYVFQVPYLGLLSIWCLLLCKMIDAGLIVLFLHPYWFLMSWVHRSELFLGVFACIPVLSFSQRYLDTFRYSFYLLSMCPHTRIFFLGVLEKEGPIGLLQELVGVDWTYSFFSQIAPDSSTIFYKL